MLAFYRFDRGRAEAVFPEHEPVDEQPKDHQHVTEQRNKGRDARPAEAIIQGANNQHRGRTEDSEPSDHLLNPSRFRAGAEPLAPLKQDWVLEREIHADQVRRDREDGEEQLALPIVQRPCRQDDEDRQRGDA